MSSSRKRFVEEGKAAPENKKQKYHKYSVTQPQRLHYGLYNQGATCYLNSVLQVLFRTTEIHDRLDSKLQPDVQLRNIFEGLKEKTRGTETLTETFGIENVHQQRDAAECLEMILHKISPQASEVFQGELRYTIKCSTGHSINEETNPFWTLPLPLTDTQDTNYRVEKGLERIFQLKSFSGDNSVYCCDCNRKTKATSGCEMVKSPQILTLLLKRFDIDYNTMSHVKSDLCVDVPLTLQIKKKTYKLYGMVNHMGGITGGHYTATILSSKDTTCYEFDDDHVRKVKEQPFAQSRTYNSSAAYLLMYRASGRQRDTVKRRQDEMDRLDDERGHKVEHKRNVGNANRRSQESQGRMSKDNCVTFPPGENPLLPDKRSTKILKNPVFVALFVTGCVLILILLLWC